MCRFKAWLVPRGGSSTFSPWAINSSTSPSCPPQRANPDVCHKPFQVTLEKQRGTRSSFAMKDTNAVTHMNSTGSKHCWGNSLDKVPKGNTPPQRLNCTFYRQYCLNLWKTGSYLLALTFNCYTCTHHGLYDNVLARGRPHLAQQTITLPRSLILTEAGL